MLLEVGLPAGVGDPTEPGHSKLVCWSRMQAEAGQGLHAIVGRKEVERITGGGLFFWGVGNAPARGVAALARAGTYVEAVFSIMLAKPKLADSNPLSVVAWRRFVDMYGIEREVPANVVVTSRGGTARQYHYALVCRAESPLVLGDFGPFDPCGYRNIGVTGGPIGASQVTALVEPVQVTGRADDRYRVNLRATLSGSYWVKLVDPVQVGLKDRLALASAGPGMEPTTWLKLAARVRGGRRLIPRHGEQRELFA